MSYIELFQRKQEVENLFEIITTGCDYTDDEVECAICDLIEIYADEPDHVDLIDELDHLLKYYSRLDHSLQYYYVFKVGLLNPYLELSEKKYFENLLLKEEENDKTGKIIKQEKIKKILKLSNILKKLREINNISTEKLAQLSGVSGALINKIENAKITSLPKSSTLLMLADALSVDASYFGVYENTKQTNKSLKINDLKAILLSLGYDAKYATQIYEYAETMMLKQKLEKGELNV